MGWNQHFNGTVGCNHLSHRVKLSREEARRCSVFQVVRTHRPPWRHNQHCLHSETIVQKEVGGRRLNWEDERQISEEHHAAV